MESDSVTPLQPVTLDHPCLLSFFFVFKKDKTLRPCIDFRGLNDITIRNHYPLPLIGPSFKPLNQGTVFSKLDLRSAYHLVWVWEGDKWKSAFNTPLGHFGYPFWPHGCCSVFPD